MGTQQPIEGRCGARNRDGSFCAAFPLRDKRRCRRHGGRAGRPPTHGLYSRRFRRLSEEGNARIEALAKDPDLLNLKQPVAVLAYLLEESMETLAESGNAGDDEHRERVIERCGALADRLSRRQTAVLERAARQTLIRDQVLPMFNELGKTTWMLVRQYVPVEHQEEFRQRLRSAMLATMGQISSG